MGQAIPMGRRSILATGAASLAVPSIARAQAVRTLKFVPYGDLSALDPILTSNYAVRNHALMVFDTLYGVDDQNIPQPQMVAGHVVDDDGKTWTLTLRDGMRFHDATPVLARDVVASIRRWAVRDLLGGMLMETTAELSAPDDRTVKFRLKAPFPLLPYACGKMVGNVLAIMPERLAATAPTTAIPEVIGSGPFRYLPAERLQGARNVYARFDGYVPRADGVTSRLAGPKIAHFDRVEWLTMPDPATAVNALQQGEVDWVENPLADLVPGLRKRAGIATQIMDPSGYYRYVRLNHLVPPFDKPAVRRAALAAITQSDVLTAITGTDTSLWHPGVGFFSPDSAMASTAGMAAVKDPADLARARKLLQDSGYNGEKTVFMAAGTVHTLNATAEVTVDAWRKIGFNAEYQPLEIAAAIQRLNNRGPIEQGGWNASADAYAGVVASDPVLFNEMRAVGASGTYGWPDIPALVQLRTEFLAATDLPARQAICRKMQEICFDQVPCIPVGVTYQPTAFNSALTGVLKGLALFYNVKRA